MSERERQPLSLTGTYAAVFFGVFVAASVWTTVEGLVEGDADPNTYKPSELVMVEFMPEEGVSCVGLSPEGQDQVLTNTVKCDFVAVSTEG